jgi:hypothetical protein
LGYGSGTTGFASGTKIIGIHTQLDNVKIRYTHRAVHTAGSCPHTAIPPTTNRGKKGHTISKSEKKIEFQVFVFLITKEQQAPREQSGMRNAPRNNTPESLPSFTVQKQRGTIHASTCR